MTSPRPSSSEKPNSGVPYGVPCQHFDSSSSNHNIWIAQTNDGSDEHFPSYSSLLGRDGQNISDDDKTVWRKDVAETIEKALDDFGAELRVLSLDIHDHPELGYEEHHAHAVLTRFMEGHGFEVEKHYKDLSTAWRASFTHTPASLSSPSSSNAPLRTLGLNSEMDALPGIGHACGHNLIAIAGVGVALALRAALIKHDLPGKVVLLGTPAEEGGVGKAVLLERGAYKDMDVCLMCHPGPGPKMSAGTASSLALAGIDVEYFGHTAHASAAPWEAQNALDAAFLAYSAIAVLRQQIKPTHRVHGIVEGKEWAPNIIPDYAKMRWLVRAPSAKEVEILRERVMACFRAAAEATGCKVEFKQRDIMYDLRQNSVLAEDFHAVGAARFGMHETGMEGAIGGSTDFGNVTYELPSLHPAFSIPTEPNGGNHTPQFAAAARRKEAHEATLVVAKMLAHVGMRVLQDDGFLEKVKGAFNPEK